MVSIRPSHHVQLKGSLPRKVLSGALLALVTRLAARCHVRFLIVCLPLRCADFRCPLTHVDFTLSRYSSNQIEPHSSSAAIGELRHGHFGSLRWSAFSAHIATHESVLISSTLCGPTSASAMKIAITSAIIDENGAFLQHPLNLSSSKFCLPRGRYLNRTPKPMDWLKGVSTSDPSA
ncbi:hypothetical protein IW140_004323 [Coemansia sp. RSA 1813]|nr:hypothetical protein EV178_004395 [Coemansia sp. RSA 1646]KAJ1769403.1 hypothetical protein LPJ74_004066 [Coemansia sp. RSA 1843]KAJ2087975.1 hypothetical protein IW138_004572 [Coemansia sp. RSA 986]KAJ2211257.1 hypothetical protein EV179_005621 [Coemansia sp. RSA 487]KAJ2567813.1 hypothetical protein IW140_004323 [Coemansia sp. RSA 1813]